MTKTTLMCLGLALAALSGCKGHLPIGAPCTSDRQCHGKLTCDSSGACAKTNCVGVGKKCSTNEDCCGTLYCSGRTCH